MLAWITDKLRGGGADEPVSLLNARGVEAFLRRVPSLQPVAAVEELAAMLEKATQQTLPLEAARHAIRRIDEHAQGYLPGLWQALIDDPKEPTRDAPWHALPKHFRAVARGYGHLLGRMPPRDRISEAERADALLATVRGIAALAAHKLLLRMRYREPDAEYWQALNTLGGHAESSGLLTTLVEPYAGAATKTCAEREFLLALMLDVAPCGSMLPADLRCLDLVLRRHAAHLQFVDAPRDPFPFCYDPANPPPRRWLQGLKPRPGMRFFGIGRGFVQIAALQKQSASALGVPDFLSGSGCDLDTCRRTLATLVHHWSASPPQRRHRRDRREAELIVTHDLAQIRRMLACAAYARTGGQVDYTADTPYDTKVYGEMRFGSARERPSTQQRLKPVRPLTPIEVLERFELAGDRQMAERWKLVDISDGGVGVIATSHRGWARVGGLVAFRYPDKLDWQLAHVRRITRNAQGKLSIGLECLKGEALCSTLRVDLGREGDVWDSHSGERALADHDAILLRGERDTLLIPPGRNPGNHPCQVSLDKRWRPVAVGVTLQCTPEYERLAIAFEAEER